MPLLKIRSMKTCSFVSAAFLAVFCLSCQRTDSAGPLLVRQVLDVSMDQETVKAVLNPLDDSKVLWSAGEEVAVFVGNTIYQFTGNNAEPSASARFEGEAPVDMGTYVMLSPYNASATKAGGTVNTTLPAAQTGFAGSYADGTIILAGTSSTASIRCLHVCSGVRFKTGRAGVEQVALRGNSGERIAGDFSFSFSEGIPVASGGTEEVITLTAPGGGTFDPDTWYYIVSLPKVFANGVTLTAYAGSQVGTLVISTKNLTFTRGIMKQVASLGSRMVWENPSGGIYYGPENSFCVAPGTSVAFDVTPRLIGVNWQRSGLASISAARAASAQVLWGGATASLDGTTLTMRSTSEGSSLVAIKDSGGSILWSYLLWVRSSFPETNLPSGAKALPALGGELYFQWGRKDPLQSSASREENKGTSGLVYSIANPTVFIRGESGGNYDWFTNDPKLQDATLWGDEGSKTVWDPCPAGYRVPSSTVFSDVGFTFSYFVSNFDELGYLNEGGLYPTLRSYWTRTADSYAALALDDSYTGRESVFYGQMRNIASPIRCVKE